MSRMFNPPHPGETLKEDVLPALGLSVTEAAAQLGADRQVVGVALELDRLAVGAKNAGCGYHGPVSRVGKSRVRRLSLP